MTYRMLPEHEIKPGQVWLSCSNHRTKVTVVEVTNTGQVHYEYVEKGQMVRHDKDAFSFQCRYFLPGTEV